MRMAIKIEISSTEAETVLWKIIYTFNNITKNTVYCFQRDKLGIQKLCLHLHQPFGTTARDLCKETIPVHQEKNLWLTLHIRFLNCDFVPTKRFFRTSFKRVDHENDYVKHLLKTCCSLIHSII